MEHSSAAPTFVGIDVAKDRLDVHLRPANEALAFGRDSVGLAALVERLVALRPALVVLEATGGFEVTVAGALAAAKLPVVVVNPRQIRDFARATGRLAKTDRLDAAAIARFAEAVRPAPRPLPSAAAQALGELVARRRQLVDMITSEGQRRRQARDPRLGRRLEAHVTWLQKELAALEADLNDTVRGSPVWRAAEDLLASVPGIGKTSARTLIAELPELHALGASSGRAPEMTVVSAASDALQVVNRERVCAVLVERRPAGGLSERTIRALVNGARGRPGVWLIQGDDIVEIAEAVAAGVSGAYYWDQVGPDLLSAMDRLALSSADSSSQRMSETWQQRP